MDTIRDYKCPSCNAPLAFDGGRESLHCASCGNDFSLETMTLLEEADKGPNEQSAYDWENYEPRAFSAEEAAQLAGYTCPSCAAEITGDESMGASVCPYCGNTTIIKGQFAGSLMPDYVIPFSVDKKSAMQRFEEACARAPFLPDEFKNRRKIEEMTGVYVPFWMFDCDCNASITYRAERVHMWSDASYNYVKTDHFKLLRRGGIGFANIPVDGSGKADNTYMEAVEQYDYSAAMDFNTAYLSGFFADKYDVSMEESKARANERIQNSTEAAFAGTTDGYAAVRPEHTSIRFSDSKVRYALLPVWMLHIRYKDAVYNYAINGQTGKTVGEYPICKKKQNLFFAKVYGISLAIAAVVGALYLYWG